MATSTKMLGTLIGCGLTTFTNCTTDSMGRRVASLVWTRTNLIIYASLSHANLLQ